MPSLWPALRRNLPLLGVLMGLLLAAVWVQPVAALERRSGPGATVAAGETINDDLAIAGESVTIGGHVAGDVFAAGSRVTVLPGARIDGDLLAAGATLTVGGTVGGDARVTGATIQIDGAVGRNVTAVGSQLTLGPSASVGGNWLSGSEGLTLQGAVTGNVTAGAGTTHLAGAVGRNVELGVGQLAVQPSARVGGDLRYVSRVDVAVPVGSVQGQVQRTDPPQPPAEERRRGPDIGGIVFGLVLLAGSVLVGLLLGWLVPGLYRSAQQVLERRALVAFALGLVVLVVVPVAALLLLITVLGAPLAALGLVAYFAGWYIGWLVAAAALAGVVIDLVRRGVAPAWGWLVVAGLVGLHLMTWIPYIGPVVTFLVLCLGLGTLLLLLSDRWRAAGSVPAPPLEAGLPGGGAPLAADR